MEETDESALDMHAGVCVCVCVCVEHGLVGCMGVMGARWERGGEEMTRRGGKENSAEEGVGGVREGEGGERKGREGRVGV